ncbi:hypothetical protein [Paractinoplanes atraurantiacus]|uniref:Uncharacterized protein n=1 Tax=Paractinoplanes atraurantiacus TaxID=1036182 RepID=A0A285KJV3_9ACTN|nr:hypothetical protein [Actinoplanes atraurantiacus]SNY72875.1 hypothetical protein SAMN05421748_14439 [Actinoplanes atraurantiacus]
MTGPADPQQLRAPADAERAKFWDLAAVTDAEDVTRAARIAELAARQKAAYRRVVAARGRLTRARRDGSAAQILAAADRLRELQAEADRVADTGIAEMQALIGAGLDNTGVLIEQMGRTSAAQTALTDTYRGGTGAGG